MHQIKCNKMPDHPHDQVIHQHHLFPTLAAHPPQSISVMRNRTSPKVCDANQKQNIQTSIFIQPMIIVQERLAFWACTWNHLQLVVKTQTECKWTAWKMLQRLHQSTEAIANLSHNCMFATNLEFHQSCGYIVPIATPTAKWTTFRPANLFLIHLDRIMYWFFSLSLICILFSQPSTNPAEQAPSINLLSNRLFGRSKRYSESNVFFLFRLFLFSAILSVSIHLLDIGFHTSRIVRKISSPNNSSK